MLANLQMNPHLHIHFVIVFCAGAYLLRLADCVAGERADRESPARAVCLRKTQL